MNVFLLLNSAVVILLVYLFIKDRKKKPSQTKFNINRKGKPLDFTVGDFFRGREKQLNILFNFNGETWDAYEILGIPAGAPREEVEKAYQAHKRKGDLTEIIEAAYRTIKEQK